jgi:hypothetical protein
MGNVDVVRGMYEAFSRGDIESVLAACIPGSSGDRLRAIPWRGKAVA